MTLLILPFLSSAQSGVIKGVILNENSVPMAGEVVVLNGTNYQSITDKDGAFTMSGVTYGTYSLSVQDVAYNGFKQEVVVNAESVDVGSVKLVYSPGTTTTEADIPVVTLDDDELQSNSAQSSVSSVLGASRDAFTSAANFNSSS